MNREFRWYETSYETLALAHVGCMAAVIIGFASTILVLMQAAQAIGATIEQQASMAAILCFMMAATTLVLCVRYKMPMLTAWSTPGQH